MLVAVSKKQPVERMKAFVEAAAEQGIPVVFGENYVQELKAKREAGLRGASYHLIGPLQRNKVRDAVKLADSIQSVHSMPVLEEIVKEAKKLGKRQSIYLQVNIARDPAKSGFMAEEIEGAVQRALEEQEALRLDGLMTITALYDQPEASREDFRKMDALRRSLCAAGLDQAFHNSHIALSMGMSADYLVALQEGADVIRVGTALFGDR